MLELRTEIASSKTKGDNRSDYCMELKCKNNAYKRIHNYDKLIHGDPKKEDSDTISRVTLKSLQPTPEEALIDIIYHM